MIEKNIYNAIWGAIVGDALGVPVEFKSREYLQDHPLTDMIEYGTWNQPKGTWSDDSSLILATMDGIIHGDNNIGIMKRFCDWYYKAKYTAHNEVFDVGNTTAASIKNFKKDMNIDSCGIDGKDSNGNGSLMRILPIALQYYNDSPLECFKKGYEASGWTHAHYMSRAICGWYCVVVSYILKGYNIEYACNSAYSVLYIHESQNIHEFTSLQNDTKNPPMSSGYVLYSAEVAKWCMLRSSSYQEAVLRAINLGNDTDTNGCITGGLAGLYFGAVPDFWIRNICKKEYIDKMIQLFIKKIV